MRGELACRRSAAQVKKIEKEGFFPLKIKPEQAFEGVLMKICTLLGKTRTELRFDFDDQGTPAPHPPRPSLTGAGRHCHCVSRQASEGRGEGGWHCGIGTGGLPWQRGEHIYWESKLQSFSAHVHPA